MRLKFKIYHDSREPATEHEFELGKNEHGVIEVAEDDGIAVFHVVFWNYPIMVGVGKQPPEDMIIKATSPNNISLR